LTNEPEVNAGAPEDPGMKEVAELSKELARTSEMLRAMREGGIDAFAAPFATGGTGRAAITQAIFGGGPLLRPSS